MQVTTRFSKLARMAMVSGALLAALAASNVAANPNEVGYIECDQTCAVATGGMNGAAVFQTISVEPFSTVDTYVSHVPGEIGFTR